MYNKKYTSMYNEHVCCYYILFYIIKNKYCYYISSCIIRNTFSCIREIFVVIIYRLT